MADHERAAAAAIARKLRDAGCHTTADLDVLAGDILRLLRVTYGYRHVIHPDASWQHGGPGLPSQGSDAARAIAAYRGQLAAKEHDDTALPDPDGPGYEWRREQLAEDTA
jgi:hypothetical protein